ncbi:hypothetical protein [Achromobacter xylosoxidans]|uniref:hypothetical protein n=1 Tax=Alcaligenes xylosoxydans xylosoxydans TaxID=85698 RepID=UPI001F13AE92|nr:hypothetical protein [Achromobacter xylosoxidans]
MTTNFDANEHFKELVNNAFSFTSAAVEKIDTSPQFAVIDLYTAVELFLKARLLREHWSLVVQDPKHAKVSGFISGDFISAGFDDLCKRLEHIAQAPVPKAAFSNFDGLRKSRNKIVHFANPALVNAKESTAKVYSELWGSWRHLMELLSSDWSAYFGDYRQHLNEFNARLQKHAGLLASAYEEAKEKISQRSKGKNTAVTCPHCNYAAAFLEKEHRWGGECLCMVCKSVTIMTTPTNATINCPHCRSEFQFIKQIASIDGAFQHRDVACPDCKRNLPTTELIRLCNDRFGRGDMWCEEEEGPHAARCHKCQSEPASVFYIDDFWTCVCCFERGFSAFSCDCGMFATDGAERMKYLGCFECQEKLQLGN